MLEALSENTPESLRQFLCRSPGETDKETLCQVQSETKRSEIMSRSYSRVWKAGSDVFPSETFEALADGIVIDAGCGTSTDVAEFCKGYAAHAYIGIDKFRIRSYGFGPDPVQDWSPPGTKESYIPMRHFLVRSCMLETFQHVPDATVHVVMNGVDECIITQRFAAAVALCVSRICKPGGLVFGNNAIAIEYLCDQDPLPSGTLGKSMQELRKGFATLFHSYGLRILRKNDQNQEVVL